MTHRKYAPTKEFQYNLLTVNLQKQHLANSKFNGSKFKSAIHGIYVLCDAGACTICIYTYMGTCHANFVRNCMHTNIKWYLKHD